MAYNSNVLPNSGSEGSGSNDNLYQGATEKAFSGDNIPNGFGMSSPASLKAGMETFPGSEASEWSKLKNREMSRFNDLKAKAFVKNIPITNEGIVLDGYGGAVGQGMGYPHLPDSEGSQQGNLGRRV